MADTRRESTTRLRLPKCTIPSDYWEEHEISGEHLCTYEDGRDCPYRVEVLTLKTCQYGKDEN